MHLLHRSNDTGHWRGSNDLLKIPVRNWLRPLAAEIVSGDSPSGASWQNGYGSGFLPLHYTPSILKNLPEKFPPDDSGKNPFSLFLFLAYYYSYYD